MNFKDDERYKLMDEWALNFGYYNGKIDITASDDLGPLQLMMLD